MSVLAVSAGKAVPEDVNVVIEIPALAAPVKYEVEKATGALFVDRFLSTSMHYPANYGYVPATLSEDGDPVDMLVVTPVPLVHGCVVRCRPVGLLQMEDEAGPDAKLIGVPVTKLWPGGAHIAKPEDFGQHLLQQIEHFFQQYKALEKGKWVKTNGWLGAQAAFDEINASVKRYVEASKA